MTKTNQNDKKGEDDCIISLACYFDDWFKKKKTYILGIKSKDLFLRMEQSNGFWINLTFQKPKVGDSPALGLRGDYSICAHEHRAWLVPQRGMSGMS